MQFEKINFVPPKVTIRHIRQLKGKIITKIQGAKQDSRKITFTLKDNTQIIMYHDQSCCEDVIIDDINGDIKDLLNTPILIAEERTNSEDNRKNQDDESWTWTFYEFRTIKGSVTIKWYGASNGYYSESVDIIHKKNS